jgi:hypothetical protein
MKCRAEGGELPVPDTLAGDAVALEGDASVGPGTGEALDVEV